MSKENTAVFIGHNECYGVTSEQIKEAIVSLIDKGVTEFLSGGQGGFDRLCGRCVYELKKEYPHISNYLVIPYLSFNVYNDELFDSIIYPDGFEKYHFKAAIPARNKFMVDNASYAICFVNTGFCDVLSDKFSSSSTICRELLPTAEAMSGSEDCSLPPSCM